jgi:hypothetical protein
MEERLRKTLRVTENVARLDGKYRSFNKGFGLP